MTPTPTPPGGADELRKRFEAETGIRPTSINGDSDFVIYSHWLERLVLSAESKHAEEMRSVEAENPILHEGVESVAERAKWTFAMQASEIRRLTARLSSLASRHTETEKQLAERDLNVSGLAKELERQKLGHAATIRECESLRSRHAEEMVAAGLLHLADEQSMRNMQARLSSLESRHAEEMREAWDASWKIARRPYPSEPYTGTPDNYIEYVKEREDKLFAAFLATRQSHSGTENVPPGEQTDKEESK